MWEAVFADVGVALLAILNAVRLNKMNWKLKKECLTIEEIEETKKFGNHRILTSQKEIRSKVFLL